MDFTNKTIYDDFYVAYFDASGNVIYPSDVEEVKIIRKLLKNVSTNNLIFVEDASLYYKIRVKRKFVDGKAVQIVELSNVTDLIKQLSNASVVEITHLNNRKVTRDLFMQYIEKVTTSGEDFSIVFADMDGFKEINDTYGHINGDLVLGEISRILYSYTRRDRKGNEDIVSRIGGDEFIIIFKNATLEFSYEQADKIREQIERSKVKLYDETEEFTYINLGTVSMGLYHVKNSEIMDFYNNGYTTDEIRMALLSRCNSALYESKNSGKNRVTVYENKRIKRK